MYSFRIITHKNGKKVDIIDNCASYPTKQEAVKAAQYAAAYWYLVQEKCNGELLFTISSATSWFTDELGNRYCREYKIIACQ